MRCTRASPKRSPYNGAMDVLPVDALLPALHAALAEQRSAVLQAAPGAGKTTRVPPALLDVGWLQGRKILILEPRRLAARAAARYMAAQFGEPVGETVGYRVRLDTRIGPHTRVEVVTEGVLTRLLQADPALDDYGLVIFDEFHERSLQADLALALCLDARAALRPDLRLLVMSATLDGAAVSRLLGDAALLTSEGRSFPVDTHYRPLPARERPEPYVATVLRHVLVEESGSVLAFLPGGREIRRVAALLESHLPEDVHLQMLYGDLPQPDQDAAIQPAPAGQRKLVLATSIAETSLTIKGVRVVVDAGLSRVPRFDPVSGLTRLVTLRVSRASADQRRGRAGRTEPGICYRLWSEAERLEAQSTPEILQADLAPLVLELALWGETDASRLAWLDPPPAAALAQAVELLRQLDAVDAEGRITAHGRRLLELPVHPRLAHMVAESTARNEGWLGCLLAALLSERDLLSGDAGRQADVGLRLQRLAGSNRPDSGSERKRLQYIKNVAGSIARAAKVPESRAINAEQAGRLLAPAYPDRIAKRRTGSDARYLLSNGRGAYLDPGDALAASEWLAVAELDGNPREARIFLAAPLAERDLREVFSGQIATREQVEWDEGENAVRALRVQMLGAIVLDQRPLESPDQRVAALMLDAIRRRDMDCLSWTPALRNWQARVLLLRRAAGTSWPDVSDEHLLDTLEEWLAPYLAGRSRLAHLAGLPLADAVFALLDYRQRRELEELAPTHYVVPSGSRVALDYTAGEAPVLAVRLQELFGLAQTPAILGGRMPLLLHLLSPAGRPLQITRDLPGFWQGSYQDVKKDMRGRYPKHPWPDDPAHAEPTRRAKRRSGA